MCTRKSYQSLEDSIYVKKLGFEFFSKKDIESIKQINSILLRNAEYDVAKIVQFAKHELLGILVMTVRDSANQSSKINEDTKITILKIVSLTLTHNTLDNHESLLFLNLYGSLLQEVYDLKTAKLKDTSEEYMWQVLNTVRILFDAVTEELGYGLYCKKNGMRMCKIIYVVGEILKTRCRKLKTEAIQCLMSMFKVSIDYDVEKLLRNTKLAQAIADCFAYFLPGIASSLGSVILEGERVGQNVLELTLEAVSKIMTILLKTYDNRMDSLKVAKAIVLSRLSYSKTPEQSRSKDKLEDFFEMKRSLEWFDTSDKHLAPMFAKFKYLTQCQSDRVRLKLVEMCCCLLKHCFKNIPKSSYPLVEILIIMSDDESEEISKLCKSMFNVPTLSQQVTNILSERFHENYSKIPAIFNGIDTKEQINTLKLTSASIRIVGNKIKCYDSFKEFQRTLLYLCEVKIDTSTFAEVISHEDLDSDQPISVDLWKNFKFMREENVRYQFGELCKIIYEADLFPVLSDYLINIITFEEEKVEAFYLLNQLLHGINRSKPNSEENVMNLIRPAIQVYINNWDVPLKIDDDECVSLKNLRTNILQAGLLCEGVGLMAFHAKGVAEFRPFLFNCLYKVLIRAASSHSQIQAAATKTLKNMARSLGYRNVTHMLNDNMDFFLFNIERGLKRKDYKGEVFDVMEMVMKYGDVSILQHFSDFVYEVLVQSFDKFKQNRIDSYLRVFRIFLRSLMRWFQISVPPRVFRTKAQKREDELCNFKIGGLDTDEEINDFSDDILGGKSAEEMYKEDMERKKTELEKEYIEPEVESYKKPEPPMHIKITMEILKRSLNFLPSKDADRKLLVLEILRNGIEIIKDFEDELLPIVHLIWSPLIGRFKEVDSPVLLNHSFHLLMTLGRASKDFIRNRTAKDVLPSVLSILSTFSKKSYMKDKGSSYRYSLDYKLQFTILENIVYLVTDIELSDKDIEATMDTVFLYLSDKQPIPLQTEAVKFFKLVVQYDAVFQEKINTWLLTAEKEYQKTLSLILTQDNT
ncbi:TELO2-interacting protein 1 homolog isoform X2 [Coccinella septempunctata]|nr:TELO2-interacting protein 1 homolog isoform X2 [Coccinella septempunctata]